jgi:hypothetical protein
MWISSLPACARPRPRSSSQAAGAARRALRRDSRMGSDDVSRETSLRLWLEQGGAPPVGAAAAPAERRQALARAGDRPPPAGATASTVLPLGQIHGGKSRDRPPSPDQGPARGTRKPASALIIEVPEATCQRPSRASGPHVPGMTVGISPRPGQAPARTLPHRGQPGQANGYSHTRQATYPRRAPWARQALFAPSRMTSWQRFARGPPSTRTPQRSFPGGGQAPL